MKDANKSLKESYNPSLPYETVAAMHSVMTISAIILLIIIGIIIAIVL